MDYLRRATSGALQAGAVGAGLGGGISAIGGGSPEDVGRAAMQGGISGLAGGYIGGPYGGGAALLGAGGGGLLAGLMNRGDPVDATARMILQHSRSPEDIPRVADLLFGSAHSRDEMDGRGRSRYGIGAADQGLVQNDAEKQAAIQRAYEMAGQQ